LNAGIKNSFDIDMLSDPNMLDIERVDL